MVRYGIEIASRGEEGEEPELNMKGYYEVYGEKSGTISFRGGVYDFSFKCVREIYGAMTQGNAFRLYFCNNEMGWGGVGGFVTINFPSGSKKGVNIVYYPEGFSRKPKTVFAEVKRRKLITSELVDEYKRGICIPQLPPYYGETSDNSLIIRNWYSNNYDCINLREIESETSQNEKPAF